MTEFGNRIKALRTKNGWSGPEGAVRMFPLTHASTSTAARKTFVSNVENGHQVMQESSPDFAHVARALGCSDSDLLKMIHQGQKEIRAAKTKAPKKAVVVPMPEAALPRPVANGPAARRLRGHAKVTANGHRRPAAMPAVAASTRAELGLDGIAAELTAMFQKTSQSPAIRGIHHDALSAFVRRVVSAACKMQGSLS
jgi:transcriptional regulator with XRE-family HTH domain